MKDTIFVIDYCEEEISNEKWKDIPSYEGLYQASNLGRIRSIEGKITHSVRHGVRHWKSKILKTRGLNPITGHRVTLWKYKKSKDWLVARLVCLTWHGIPPTKLTVNHINGNRFDNRIENLEWLTIGDNVRHAFENNLVPQINCLLVDSTGIAREFKSLSKASQFLGRNHGYAHLHKNSVVTDSSGKKYKLLCG